MIKKILGVFFLCLLGQMSFAQSGSLQWVDSVFHELNAGEKIGQLFLVPVSQQTDQRTINEIETLIKSHEIGGLIFKRMNPVEQARLTNHFQDIARVPLLIAMEGDINTMLDTASFYPAPLALGAIQSDTLLYQLGAAMARQLRMIGVNVLFTPKPSVLPAGANASPSPESFGQDKNNVARKSVALMRGLQDNGILACAQYSALQGITVLEVRKRDLPTVRTNLDTLQNYPFHPLISGGLKGIVPAAAEFPLFYNEVSNARKGGYTSGTLSSLYTAEWLENQMNFKGLVFVDMSKIDLGEKQKNGDAEMAAFKKGNDVLMYPREIGPAIRKIKKLLRKESNYEVQLAETVRKILRSKAEAGLARRTALSLDNLQSRLNGPDFNVLRAKLYQNTITVIRNVDEALPIRILEDKKFAFVSTTSSGKQQMFHEYLGKYSNFSTVSQDAKTNTTLLKKSLQSFDVIVAAVFPETSLDQIKQLDEILGQLKEKRQIVLCDFGNNYFWQIASKYQSVITAYAPATEAVQAVPQVIFGALPASGRVPFTPSALIVAGSGTSTEHIDRLAYSSPEDARMNGRLLAGIDSIAAEAMRIGATPGCQVLVARHGKVIYEKNFGKLTYEDSLPVTGQTIYDLASVTKVSATLQTAMFMYERGLLDLNRKVSYYLPELKKTNKRDITVMDMLTHQSGLVPFIPMYPQTMKDTIYLPQYYSRTRNEKYPLQVGEKLFASTALKDSVWSWIIKSKMADKPSRTPYSYKYSDLGFLILQRMAEKILNQPMDDFLAQNLYEPLGAYTTGFNPLSRFSKRRIAPTEDDKIYRKSFVSGTVHDERAAMLGGVAGHAGLFSTANDLAKLGQMLLQEGSYGGIQYYKPETVRLFTAKKFRNSRRGIGWDKPIPSDPGTLTSFYASPATYGHTGFTGTCIWVDPEFDLVYIFLSNRVYPDRNNKLSNANIRSRIQDVIYKSIFEYVAEEKEQVKASDLAINSASPRP
jgi:beta-N-acetylhexosaminidase